MKITDVQMTGTSGLGHPRGTIEFDNHTLSICLDVEEMRWQEDPEEELYEIGVLDDKGLIYTHIREEETPEGHKEKTEELINLLEDYGMGRDGVMRGLSKERMLEAVNILVTWALDKE